MKLSALLVFYIAIVISACGLVYSKHLQRRQFVKLQALQTQSLRLQTEWERLLLEESAWSNQARIEQIASRRLGMRLVNYADMVMLELNK